MTEQAENEKPKEETEPKLRWYQYSLRSLMIFMLVAGVFFGWLGEKIREIRRQKVVVEWIRVNGGTISYHYDFTISSVTFVDVPITELSSIENITDLEYLWLGGTKVTDLSPLKNMKNLKELGLPGTPVTDLSPLKGLTNIRKLILRNTQVTDLSPLKGFTNLAHLDLEGTKVIDLSPLRDLKKLKSLKLNNSQITDLVHLQDLTNLEWLDLYATPVTKEEIQKLREALPNCEITLPAHLR